MGDVKGRKFSDQRLSHLWDIKEVCMGCLGFEWWWFAFLVTFP